MPNDKSEVDFDLLKRVIEESGLSTIDLINKILGLGETSGCQHSGCSSSCINCSTQCASGPTSTGEVEKYIIYPHDWERLKREIIAELKG